MSIIFIGWCLIIILMLIAWCIYLKIKNPAIIDFFWPIAILVACLCFSFTDKTHPIKLVFQILVIIWSVRLAGYLLITRIIPQHVDKRYQNMSEQWVISKNLAFLMNYQLQGLLALIIATPFLFINTLSKVTTLNTISAILIMIGIIGESIADFQLQKFKKFNNKLVCDSGLWRYSRHPNYFFEWLIWLSFTLASLNTPIAWIGMISPALLLIIMLKITVPITEAGSIKSKRKLYSSYQDKTSMFVPLPPKKDL